MSASQRIKGRNFEQEVARELRKVFPDVERAWEAANGKGYDLENTGNLRIQCKRRKRAVPISFLWDVPGPIPVLVGRSDREEAVVSLRLTDFVKILGDIGEVYVQDDR